MPSRLAENVVHFTRLLRAAGLRLGPASALDALAAASAVDVLQRDEMFWSLHAVLVKRPEDFDLYEQAFRLFWRDPQGVNNALALLLPQVRVPRPSTVSRRLAEAWRQPSTAASSPTERLELDAWLTFSADEVLRTRDFDQMSAEELRRAKRA